MNVLGASVLEDTATFGVWAPRCQSVDVAIEGRHPQPMGRDADGVFTATLGDLAPGTRYKYRLDGERYRPDPGSPSSSTSSTTTSAPRAITSRNTGRTAPTGTRRRGAPR